MKRIIIVILTVALSAALLTGCGKSGSAAVKEYNIGVSIFRFDDDFMTLYREEIKNYFKSLESDKVKYNIVVVDGRSDMTVQADQVDDFIEKKFDVLIINLVNSSSANIIT